MDSSAEKQRCISTSLIDERWMDYKQPHMGTLDRITLSECRFSLIKPCYVILNHKCAPLPVITITQCTCVCSERAAQDAQVWFHTGAAATVLTKSTKQVQANGKIKG